METLDSETIRFLAERLGVSPATRNTMGAFSHPIHPDLCFDDGKRLILIEAKRSRAGPETVRQVALLRDYFHRRPPWSERIVEIAVAAPSIAPDARSVLEAIGGQFIPLPASLVKRSGRGTHKPRGKLTSPAAWSVVSELLRAPGSIQGLSRRTGVSYAWCHRTITALASQGLVRRTGGRLEVTDLPRLLSGVAWERPLASLRSREIVTSLRDPGELARLLTSRAGAAGAVCALTGPSWLLFHGDFIRSVNRVDAYLAPASLAADLAGKGGVSLVLYHPDRPVRREVVEDVSLVDAPQAVLDLAGLGPNWFEMASQAVKALAQG